MASGSATSTKTTRGKKHFQAILILSVTHFNGVAVFSMVLIHFFRISVQAHFCLKSGLEKWKHELSATQHQIFFAQCPPSTLCIPMSQIFMHTCTEFLCLLEMEEDGF